MEKPQLETLKAYNYNKCCDYLQKKYGYNERDYAGKFKCNKKGTVTKVKEEVAYLDFWHWVINNHEIHNGCFIHFSRQQLDEIDKDWVREIYNHYLDEFADEKGNLTLYCSW